MINSRCGHSEHVETCLPCRLFKKYKKYRRAWRVNDDSGKTVTTKNKQLPNLYSCIHRGERTGKRRECQDGCARGSLIPLQICKLHSECTVTKSVGPETRCCRTCPDRQENSGILIPRPPPLTTNPTQSRALITVAAGEEGKALFETTRPLFENYAKRVGADLLVLDWEGHPDWPMSCKFALPRVLDHWERIAYVDADCLLLPDSPDLFAQCAEDEFGACDEITWHKFQTQHRREADYLRFRERMGFKKVEKLPWMFNCGVMVVPRIYQHLLEAPVQPIVPHHCAEQDHTNARVLDAFLEGKCKVRLLDRRCNWQNWTDWGFEHAPPGSILHWSGGGAERKDRPSTIRKFIKSRGLTPEPPQEGKRVPFVIASSQRSGSTLLAHTLRAAGLGDVGELFTKEFRTSSSREEMLNRGCVKVHWYQMEHHGLHQNLLLEGARWIFLSRRNVLRQAVSLWKGRQTRAWTSEQRIQGESRYNRNEIDSCIRELIADTEGWEQYFQKFGIRPLPVYYEDLEKDFERTIRRILSFLESPHLTVPQPPLRKMADGTNEEWVRLYLSGQ